MLDGENYAPLGFLGIRNQYESESLTKIVLQLWPQDIVDVEGAADEAEAAVARIPEHGLVKVCKLM